MFFNLKIMKMYALIIKQKFKWHSLIDFQHDNGYFLSRFCVGDKKGVWYYIAGL